MPFIRIKSLPFEEKFNITKTVLGISNDFSLGNSIPVNHVHTTWEFYTSGHYAKGENAPTFQPYSHHPIIVDLLTPDFNGKEEIKIMLESLAKSISNHSKMNLSNIFINHQPAQSGMVFDDGKIVEW